MMAVVVVQEQARGNQAEPGFEGDTSHVTRMSSRLGQKLNCEGSSRLCSRLTSDSKRLQTGSIIVSFNQTSS